MTEVPAALAEGPLYLFRDWPNPEVPQVAAGTYTIWHEAELVYVGMAGRSLTIDTIAQHRADSAKGKGLFSRLNSHAFGRRSGDQFCVYVADRLVLPLLTPVQVSEIVAGTRSLDAMVREFIQTHLGYRYCEAPDGAVARAWEARIRAGALHGQRPLLNPIR